jgi:hypothetical protein
MDRHRSRRELLGTWIATLITSFSLVCAFPINHAYAERSPCDDCGGIGTVLPDSGGIGVTEGAGGVTPGSGGGGTDPSNYVAYEYTHVPACSGDRQLDPVTGFTSEDDCQAARSCPEDTQTRVRIARRTVSATATGPWTYLGIECLDTSAMQAYDPAAAAAFALDYFRHLPLPVPGIHIQPGQRQVVNLPTIVSADPPPTGRWSVDHPPFPTIAIAGTPHWTINFGDGTALDSDTPGRGYDGTDPVTDTSHYLQHTYTEPAAGRTITVTVTWTATFTLGADPTPQTMDGTVTRTSSTAVPVDQAESLLTGNG